VSHTWEDAIPCVQEANNMAKAKQCKIVFMTMGVYLSISNSSDFDNHLLYVAIACE
jgi:hypothetical protein